MADIDPRFWTLLLFLLGPCLGSFASAIIYRSRIGQSWIYESSTHKSARSCCPHCGGQLTLIDLIPLLSWVCLGGKCRMCRTPISWTYPALEIAALIMAQAFLFFIGPVFATAVTVAAVPFLLTIFVMSWHGEKLPRDVMATLYGLALGQRAVEMFYAPHMGPVLMDVGEGLLAFAAAAVVMETMRAAVLRRFVINYDQLLLLLLTGIWVGAYMLPVALIVAGAYGAIAVAIRIVLKLPAVKGVTHGLVASLILILAAGTKILDLLIP